MSFSFFCETQKHIFSRMSKLLSSHTMKVDEESGTAVIVIHILKKMQLGHSINMFVCLTQESMKIQGK